ncbi:hypothetical protein E2I00_016018 [Balaenoptera physalus]|uniref:Uncharacterized protein n=1 Tax=Balaenoptera physalus TaxID=9770 RepID=A0A643C300_BALPH|nr:hypothetical protein E2I00_016018 [Balaenoptera physalus]
MCGPWNFQESVCRLRERKDLDAVFVALEEKRRKEELVKKRIELKHDKKARAMAKRTKDNFHGYNGIPVEEKSKKRQAMQTHTSQGTDQEFEMEEEDEFLEYNQAESEQEYEEEQEPPKAESKPKVPLKSAPPLMNFNDLLRLAEKKQYEPVEIKVVKKTEERPMTAEELREREFLEQKRRKRKPETDARLPPTRKVPSQKESVGTKLSKGSGDMHPSSKGTPLPYAEKKSRPSTANEKHLHLSSSKSMPGERTKVVSGSCAQPLPCEGRDRPVFNGAGKPHSSTCSPSIPKTSAKGTPKSATEHKAKKSPHPSRSRPGPMVTPHDKAKSPGVRQPGSSSSSAPGRPSTGTARPTVSSGPVPRRQNGSSNSGPERSVSGTRKPTSDLNPPGRTVSGTSGLGRPAGSSGPQRLPSPGSYKRQREDEEEEDDDEYDSEMEDFIEDEGEPQEEISKHIREIFGYDRKKYKDESDYALRYMESSWKEQQKEEAKSLRLGMQEDLDEMRREEEEMKRRKAKKLKKH